MFSLLFVGQLQYIIFKLKSIKLWIFFTIYHFITERVDFYMNLCFISKNLVKLRQNLNYSQSYVAEMLHIDRSLLCKYERGLSIPSLPLLIEIATFYDVSIDYLLSNNDI